MRLLFLLIIAAVAAYYTNPPRARFEEEARAVAQANVPVEDTTGITFDDLVGYAKGALAGRGAYENLYLLGKYTSDMPGDEYVECYGAFTLVNCRVVEPGAAPTP